METKETLLNKLKDPEIIWLNKNLCKQIGILETITLMKFMEYSMKSGEDKFQKQIQEICEDTNRSRFEIKNHIKKMQKLELIGDGGKGLFGIKYFIIKWDNVLKIINN